uniref:Uncharacterized protein n=1 Tax=Rhizophora mucronata TaxID=61149 RepID=A0A2P2P284_RHIMU
MWLLGIVKLNHFHLLICKLPQLEKEL